MVVLSLRPNNSYVDVGESEFSIRMGWAFRATVPRSSIVSAANDDGRVLGWGVHGWGGKWLVNGSSSNIVRIDIDPPVRGRVAGLPVRVRTLRASAVEPDALIAALS